MKVALARGGDGRRRRPIDDMALLRHGGMGRIFARPYAPSTLGSFLRSFTFGHVRQLDAVAARFLTALAALAGRGPRHQQRRAGDGWSSSTWTTRSSRSTATPSRVPFGYPGSVA